MKKLYLIPILMIIIWVMFINSTYATLTISNEPLSQEPAYTYFDNDIYCIEKGNEVSSSYVEPGTISFTNQGDSENIALYSTVGEYSLPVEIAYVLTSNATLQQKQYAIWHSSMNEGNKITGDPGNIELVDLPGYEYILKINSDINLKEEQMSQDTLNKDKLVKIKNNIVMENTNIEAIIKNIKVQRDTWKEKGEDEPEPDTTYLQKAYEDNEKEIEELEKNNASSTEIEELKTLNEEIKKIIDSKNYDDYIAFLEEFIKENKEAITKIETDISKYQKNIDKIEKEIKELKKLKSEEEVKLKDEYHDLYRQAGELLEDGKTYKNFYERLQREGGYNPKAAKYETKLVKKSNNEYLTGPFELEYPEGGTDNVNFSYIKNMYLEDQSGDKIDNIRIVNCEEYDRSRNYPASDARFYIEFTAREKDILEDERVSSSTWREGNYTYTETTYEKTYSVKLKVEFEYLRSCTGKYSRIEGQGDKITWVSVPYAEIPCWIAKKAGTYDAQTLIAVNKGKEIFNPDTSILESLDLQVTPTRVWDTEKLTVYANGYDEDVDRDRTQDYVNISGTKTWKNDKENQRPDSITVQLLANGIEKTTTQAKESNGWNYSFNDLPKYDSSGNEITYKVREINVPEGYKVTYNGNNITNTYGGTVDISGTKTWNGVGNNIPSSITVQLLANGAVKDSKQVTATNGWKYSFNDLPKYDSSGNEITYKVREINVPVGYRVSYNGHDIINTPDDEYVDISGIKNWVDGENKDKRPYSITVQLLANGIVKDSKEVTSSNGWEYSFTDLPKYDSSGDEIEYTVQEANVPAGYRVSYNGYDIINTYGNEYIDISGTKTWNDAGNENKRTNSITVQLLANGIVKDSKEVTSSNGWNYSFTDLPKYDSSGNEITYKVREINIPEEYTVSYEGYNIINTYGKKEPIKLTMEVAGYVFEDIAANKANEVNGLLEYNSNDRLLEGIEVAIYEENGDLVRLIQEYEENPEISKENAEIRTNPTITDRNGYYEFKGLDPDKKYYVEFRYNGLTYEATTYKASVGEADGKVYTSEAWKINSKAVETITDRTKVNNIYGEITAYPNNYKKAYDIGLGVGEYNKIYLQSDLVNNYMYLWDSESVNIYTLITRYIQKYISDNRKYPDILEIYRNIYNDQISIDSEIANKLQFIEDSKISAYTSANGDVKDLYPIYEEFAIEDEKVKIDETYEPIYEGQKYINFGIKAREEFDLSLAKDVYKAEVQINGKVHTYTYNDVEIDYTDESWNAYVKGSDVGYDRNIYAADYFAKDIGADELDVYVTYRIALRNQTSHIMAGVTKIVDYYDNEYTYVGNATTNNYTGTNKGLVYVGNSRGELVTNAIWQNADNTGNYNTAYITFENNELLVKNNEDKFIYVTFKVNTAENGLLYSDGEVKEDGTIVKQAVDAKQNIVEILGYKTYYEAAKTFSNGKTIEAGGIAGVIDRDSIVGNLNPNNSDEINKEDDSDKASGFSLLVDWSNFRGLSGNVWEELPTENSLNEGTRLGNGEKDENEVNIKNVTVKVLINGTETIAKGYVKQADGTYAWKELITVTDENGNYSFTGYIPGDYKLRFTYGNVSEDGNGTLTEEMKKYNSQDYKSTIYNNNATVTSDRPYWYSVDSDKLKSDAKDNWERRQEVNNYSIELNNEKSNILKKDSIDPILKAEKTWMLSETDKLILEVEYAREGTASVINSIDNHIYKVQNVDLGLIERPRSQVLVEKDVANVKLTLANEQGEFDAIINSEGEIEVKNDNIGIIKRTAKTCDMITTPPKFDIGQNGQITMNIDEELMQGAELYITYKVTVRNIGEIDYTTEDFYYNGVKGSEGEIAKTTASTIVDYVSTNLKTSKVSADWTIIDNSTVKNMVEFISDNPELSNAEYTAQTIDKYSDILKTNALGIGLKPDEEISIDLLLTTTLSPDNDEDDLRYDNILELVESKNEVGRRFELSVLGNQNPTKEVAELDSGKAETVLIIPPFGINDTLQLQISLAIILIAAFGIGVYYIKKRVLK